MNGDTQSGSFDIIGVTELFSMGSNQCELNGYHPIIYKTRNDTMSARGGVGMYIKETYQFSERSDLSIFIPHIFESIFIETHINNKTIIVGTIYRPNTPPKADIEIFTHTMIELLNQLKNENKDIYLMGDMNIDLLQFSSHAKTDEYLENIFYIRIYTTYH